MRLRAKVLGMGGYGLECAEAVALHLREVPEVLHDPGHHLMRPIRRDHDPVARVVREVGEAPAGVVLDLGSRGVALHGVKHRVVGLLLHHLHQSLAERPPCATEEQRCLRALYIPLQRTTEGNAFAILKFHVMRGCLL